MGGGRNWGKEGFDWLPYQRRTLDSYKSCPRVWHGQGSTRQKVNFRKVVFAFVFAVVVSHACHGDAEDRIPIQD